jgi:hypothetical protein
MGSPVLAHPSGIDIAGLPQAFHSEVNAMVPSTARVYSTSSSVIMSMMPRRWGGRHMVGVSNTS